MTKLSEPLDLSNVDLRWKATPQEEEIYSLCGELSEFQDLADLLVAKAEEAGVRLEIDHDGRSFVVHASRINYRPLRQPFRPRVVK